MADRGDKAETLDSPCNACGGDGWYTDHGDECYRKDEHIESEACPVQRQCERCKGTGRGKEV